MKSNYGPAGETVQVQWRTGVFVPIGGAGSIERIVSEQAADDLFLRLLARFSRNGRNVSDTKGTSYAPALFAQEQEAVAANIRKEAFADAMRRLFAADKILSLIHI